MTAPGLDVPPEDFASWPSNRRDEWFAESARIYREKKAAEGSRPPRSTYALQAGLVALSETDPPLPLFPPLLPSSPYPLDALGCLRVATEAIARKVQVPAATAAQSVLAVASLATQAHCSVVLPFGQKRPLSLFLATVAGSGDRKSSADNEATWPIVKREKVLREERREAMAKWKVALAAWQAEKRKIEADKTLGLEERKERLALIGLEPEKPLEPFLVFADLTLDGLTKNWINAHASLGIFTAEGGTFTGGHGMSDENRLRTATALSEVWDGKPIKRVRALDGVTILPGRRLAFHVMIQPQASAGFLADPVLRGQGLLSRILVAAPESIAGTRLYREAEPGDEEAIANFGAHILHILETPARMAEGARNELEPRDLPLSEEATRLWVGFFDHVEGQSGAKGELATLRDFASKAAEHAARIAGVLTVTRDIYAEAIELAEMENAVALVNWYLVEAERLQSASRLDGRLLRAHALLDWLKSQGQAEIQFRNIVRLGPAALRTKAAADEAVSILLDHRWVAETSSRPRSFSLREETNA